MSSVFKGLLLLVAAGVIGSAVGNMSQAQKAGPKTTAQVTAKQEVKKEAKKSGAVPIDSKLARYKKSSDEVSGVITSRGSDTMNNLMTAWVAGFKKFYPSVQENIRDEGSGAAPTALIAGTANVGPMSRAMKSEEIDKFEAKYGYKPTELPSSIDMLAVYVHKDNPIKGLNFEQLDAVFSATRKQGGDKEISTWGELGLGGEWRDKPISLYGRNAASGTYGYFKEHVLANGDFRDTVKEQAGSSAVVDAVAKDKYGIGYSGIGYKTADVNAVPLATKNGTNYVTATPDNAYSNKYPLSRFLYVYVNHKPNSKLEPLRREFIRYMFSQEGQTDVVNMGFLPITSRVAENSLKSVGLTTGTAE